MSNRHDPALRRLLGRATRLAAVAALASGSALATAQEVTLRAANAFQEGTTYARNFERWVEKVNKEGKGVVQINYVGGPKAIPTLELGNAIRNGVVDLGNTTASFTASIVPEALSINYTTMSMADLRKSGSLDELNKIMGEKGLFYYARTGEGFPYYIYLNKKIEKADLSGLKLRITPIYRDFFQKLGANVVTMAPGEVFTALERGVVDGYGWPALGIFDFGWHEKTKYRLEPGFYNIELGIMFNARKWASLTAAQRDFLVKQGQWIEEQNLVQAKSDVTAEFERQRQAGIEVIRLDPAESKRFTQTSFEEGWNQVIKASPQYGQRLKDMMYKP